MSSDSIITRPPSDPLPAVSLPPPSAPAPAGGPEPAPPSAALVEAFERQSTRDMYQKAGKYALRMASFYRLPADEALGVVHTVLAKTLAGVIAWDPDRVSLLDHVRGAVRYTMRDLTARADHKGHTSLEEGAEMEEQSQKTDAPLDGNPVEIAVSLAVGASMAEHLERRDRSRRVGAALAAALPADDEDAHAILVCWGAGVDECEDVMHFAELTEERYHNARRRLKRVAAKLPAELREPMGPTARSTP
jgi:hypothetical protein